jgi:CheY-like chemotaxis protein
MTHSLTPNPAADLTANVSYFQGTILLVEDEPTVQEVVSQLITSLGYGVVCAASAGDAVLELRKHQECIDIMLTDRLMPGVSGTELSEIVRQINPALKIILMSGHLPEALPKSQMMNFLQKPFGRGELACKLAEVMQQPASAALPSQVTEDPTLHPQPAPAR